MPLTIPSRTHGRSTTEPQIPIPAPAARRFWLTQLLAGEVVPTPFAPPAVSPRHSGVEAAVVARALGCPDLFVLDSTEANSRERAVANIVRAGADRGERFLVISPDPDAADRIVEALAADRTVRVVRALSDDENPIRPTAAVTRQTSSGAGATRAEQLRREASQTVTRLEVKLAARDRSQGFHANLEAIEHERRAVLERLDRIESEVREKPLEAPARCREIQTERESIRVRRAELERGPQTKPGILARLFGFGKPAPSADHSQELKQLADRDAALAAECAESTAKRLAEEVAARSVDLGQRLKELNADATRIDSTLRALYPQAATEDTVENGSPSKPDRAESERELAVARVRQQELTAAGSDLPRRLLAETQVVVATPGAVDCDPVFAALGDLRFDCLILDHAEELTDAAFERFAPRASRWIVAGDASPPPTPVSNGRPARHRIVEPSLLCRLARRLDREPWRIDGDRLMVRLVPLEDKDRAGLVREPLLDHPDVELGMMSVDGEPVLAEIAFPASTTIPAAKSFLVSQLGEVVLHTFGDPAWQLTDTVLTATWPLFDSCDGEWIELMDGIRERVVHRGPTAFTAALVFESATWDEAAAKEWLVSKVAPSASRVAVLPCERSARRSAYSR